MSNKRNSNPFYILNHDSNGDDELDHNNCDTDLIDKLDLESAARADEVEVEEQVRKRSATAEAMGAKTLCIPLEQPELPPGTQCFVTGRPAKNWALWGRSY